MSNLKSSVSFVIPCLNEQDTLPDVLAKINKVCETDFKELQAEVMVFADADNTYDFLETPRLVSELEKGFDLVIGSRIEGDIHTGAMPFLHRYLGTPILNYFINLLYAKKGNKITDCNSGFHCFKRDSFFHGALKVKGWSSHLKC